MCPRLKWQSTYHRDEDSLEVGFREKKYCPYMIREGFKRTKGHFVAGADKLTERERHFERREQSLAPA